MSGPLFVVPDVVRGATGALRTSSIGHGARTTGAAGAIDGASADAAVSRLVEVAGSAAIELATNIGAIFVAIDDQTPGTVSSTGALSTLSDWLNPVDEVVEMFDSNIEETIASRRSPAPW